MLDLAFAGAAGLAPDGAEAIAPTARAATTPAAPRRRVMMLRMVLL
jgi:hypothetical protein